MRINDTLFKMTSLSIPRQGREIRIFEKRNHRFRYLWRRNAVNVEAHGSWKIKFKDARSHMRRRKKMRASQGKSSSSSHMLLYSARSSPEWNYSTCFETLNPLSVYLPTVVKRTSSDTRPSFIRTEN